MHDLGLCRVRRLATQVYLKKQLTTQSLDQQREARSLHDIKPYGFSVAGSRSVRHHQTFDCDARCGEEEASTESGFRHPWLRRISRKVAGGFRGEAAHFLFRPNRPDVAEPNRAGRRTPSSTAKFADRRPSRLRGASPGRCGPAHGLVGGSAWELNPPGAFVGPHDGFEVRAAHQHRSAPEGAG